MANALKILSEVQAAGGRLELMRPDRLRIVAPSPLPCALMERVKVCKPDLIRFLSETCPDAFDREAFAERTAIIETNGIPREWADGFATLCTMARPSAYTPARWQQLVNDGGYFLDAWGRQAAALGWKALDCFGVNPESPEWRYDAMGLVAVLCGRKVSAITADTARIQSGGRFYRQNTFTGAVAFWELKP